jgi:hypothetical protein
MGAARASRCLSLFVPVKQQILRFAEDDKVVARLQA